MRSHAGRSDASLCGQLQVDVLRSQAGTRACLRDEAFEPLMLAASFAGCSDSEGAGGVSGGNNTTSSLILERDLHWRGEVVWERCLGCEVTGV